MGGVEEDLDTKLYKVPVCDDNVKLVQTIRAVGVPQISDETANPNVNYISSVLGIPVNQLSSIPYWRNQDKRRFRGTQKPPRLGSFRIPFKGCPSTNETSPPCSSGHAYMYH